MPGSGNGCVLSCGVFDRCACWSKGTVAQAVELRLCRKRLGCCRCVGLLASPCLATCRVATVASGHERADSLGHRSARPWCKMEGGNLIMLPRDAPTDVLNEIQLVKDFYGADTPADHQRVMALFAPNAKLDLPHLLVSGREDISAVMFYAKSFIADVDIEPYMVEVGAAAVAESHQPTETTSLLPESSATSTDSTSSTCTSAATSKRRRAGSGRPPKAPSAGTSGAAAAASPNSAKQPQSRLGRKHQSQQISSDITQPRTRSRQQHSDLTDQGVGFDTTAQNGRSHQHQGPRAMSRTHVYAVSTITPKSVARMFTLNLLPR